MIGRIDVTSPAKQVFNQFVRAAKQDIAIKSQLMARAAIPISAAADYIISDASLKMAQLQQAAARAVRNNEFFMNDAWQASAQAWAAMM